MGKASEFFKSFFGYKTTAPQRSRSDPNRQHKRPWSFVKSQREAPRHLLNSSRSSDGTHSPRHPHHHRQSSDRIGCGDRSTADPNKHEIALAAATAAVVDEAAQEVAEVVRMTSRTTVYGVLGELAAVKIQSYFRAYLARRALRALKSLVKLQALVRGHILRKQTADMMRCLQVLIRAQARARSHRSQISDSPQSTTKASSQFHRHWNGTNPHIRQTNLFEPDHISFGYGRSLSNSRGSVTQPTSSSPCASCEVNFVEGSMREGPATPNKSDGSRSCINGYPDHPNYMAYTKSSRAKVRSRSAPRLRCHFENSKPTKRVLVYGHGA